MMTKPSTVRRNRITRVDIHEVHRNVSQEIIEITSDKLEIILNDFIKSVKDSRDWQVPLGIFMTIILVLCTTSFKDAFGLTKDTWNAIFVICAIVTLVWSIKSFFKSCKIYSTEQLINKMKNKA